VSEARLAGGRGQTEGEFVDRRRVRYHEVDAQGIAFNSRYLEYIDVAMTEWFRWLGGWTYPELVSAGCDPSLVSLTIEWSSPASLDEEIEVAVDLVALGRSSFTLAFRFSSAIASRPVAAATVVYVNVDPPLWQSRTLPAAVRERMNVHLVATPVADGQSTSGA